MNIFERHYIKLEKNRKEKKAKKKKGEPVKQKILENKIEGYLIKLLNEKGIFHFKGKVDGLKGYPDRTVLADFEYHVETKVSKEYLSYYKQTPMQKWWQKKFENSNAKYILLEDFEEVENFVAKLPSQIKREN
jgi:ribosomal protein S17E